MEDNEPAHRVTIGDIYREQRETSKKLDVLLERTKQDIRRIEKLESDLDELDSGINDKVLRLQRWAYIALPIFTLLVSAVLGLDITSLIR